MALPIHTAFPNAEILLALQPEELGGIVLEFLKAQGGSSNNTFQRSAFIHLDNLQGYPRPHQQEIMAALREAWNWLLSAGLIAQQEGAPHETFFITRRGLQLRSRQDFETFRKARLLPNELLHASIAEPIWQLFIRGDYDTAVFEAFKEVEVAVRTAGRFAQTDIGVPLMRKAFHTETGLLRDGNAHEAERQSLSDLFAGAIGSYKNPTSHRHVAIGPEEAAEMIMLASHLLTIVDSRRPAVG